LFRECVKEDVVPKMKVKKRRGPPTTTKKREKTDTKQTRVPHIREVKNVYRRGESPRAHQEKRG